TTASTTANVTRRLLTVTAVTKAKEYDGTTAATGAVPAITTGSLAASDTASFTETFADRNVGTGKRLSPAGSVSDGNGGNNYSVTYVPVHTGVIAQPSASITYKAGYASVVEPLAGEVKAYLFTISLDVVPSQAVTVYYRTADGSAVAGEDYVGV